MTQAVYKYEIGPGVTKISVPKGAVLLYGSIQHQSVFVWARVDIDANEHEDRTVLFIGTGHPMPQGMWRYLNTTFEQGGRFVFHTFEAVS